MFRLGISNGVCQRLDQCSGIGIAGSHLPGCVVDTNRDRGKQLCLEHRSDGSHHFGEPWFNDNLYGHRDQCERLYRNCFGDCRSECGT
jgi:hypothetical protein